MRIAIVAPQDLRLAGGVEKVVRSIAKELVALGEIVTVDCPRERTITKGLTIESAGFTTAFHLDVWRIGQFGHVFPGVFISLLRSRPNLIHVHSYRHPHTIFGLLAAKILGVPCILSSHSSEQRNPRSKMGSAKSFFDKTVGKASIRSFSRIICADPEEPAFFQALGAPKSKLATIGHGVDRIASLGEINGPRIRGRILIVSRLEKLSNAGFLLPIIDSMPEAEFVIVGPTRADDEEFRTLLLSKRNVSLRGEVTAQELETEYLEAEVLVHPIKHEPFGLVVREALARGLPVAVGQDVPAAHGVQTSALRVVEGSNGELWAKEIRALQTAVRADGSLRSKACDAMKRHTWKLVIMDYEGLYREALLGKA
jgi:glycosyltransferase involved in cell wall biosynthesis